MHDDAIRENTARFSALTEGRVMAVLKADAFGHGAIARSVLESGATSLGVTSVDEALALRATGIGAPILSWLNTPDADFETAVRENVDLAVPSVDLLYSIGWAALRVGTPARVHLHIDVGMARDGCAARDWPTLCALAREHEALGAIRVVGVMGHMSCADDPGNPQNTRERLVFESAVRTARRRTLAPHILHLAATAATLTGVGSGFDVHRIGAGLFGIDPSCRTDMLRPAVTLTSRVVSSREVSAGTGVGYGLDYVTRSRTNLALLPIGYGDGLPREASGRAEVLARGRRRPLVGRFSMDMVVVDTGDDVLRPNERVTFFGPGSDGEPTVAEWAEWAHTIEHEIVTRVGNRIPRIHRTIETASQSQGAMS
ncbi:alanine racemase [Agromyces sp. Root81]|uniref:alanine racemase n=1 Tax=Agromyces sp. Root81 TaxID=1736601 RepID=UPI000A773050|nr:alanine racemase [Agromyces sp. Root81]